MQARGFAHCLIYFCKCRWNPQLYIVVRTSCPSPGISLCLKDLWSALSFCVNSPSHSFILKNISNLKFLINVWNLMQFPRPKKLCCLSEDRNQRKFLTFKVHHMNEYVSYEYVTQKKARARNYLKRWYLRVKNYNSYIFFSSFKLYISIATAAHASFGDEGSFRKQWFF